MENGRNAALNGGRGSGQTVRRITELYENKIADIKANCDLAIEGRDVKIMELEQQIEKMKADVKQEQSYWNSGEMQYGLFQRLLDKWEIKEND